MRHSFIKARRKQIVSAEMKLVLFFFGMTLFLLLGTYAFILLKTFSFEHDMTRLAKETELLRSEMSVMDKQIMFIEKESAHAEQIFTSNTVLKESIKNLFDLVPERITLSQAELDERKLVLYGVTPNKEVYEFLLQAPLRSIFHRTYSSFYPVENGWYQFVSTNYLDKEEME